MIEKLKLSEIEQTTDAKELLALISDGNLKKIALNELLKIAVKKQKISAKRYYGGYLRISNGLFRIEVSDGIGNFTGVVFDSYTVVAIENNPNYRVDTDSDDAITITNDGGDFGLFVANNYNKVVTITIYTFGVNI